MLTRLEVENARPKEKPYRLFDGRGVYLEVSPSGGRHWRLKYRSLDGRTGYRSASIQTLASRRRAIDATRRAASSRTESIPLAERKLDKVMKDEKAANTFEAVARVVRDALAAVGGES